MGKSEGIISSRTKYVEVFSRTVILIEVYPMYSDDCTIPMVSFLLFNFFIYPPLFFISPSFPPSSLFLVYIHDPFSCFLYLISAPPLSCQLPPFSQNSIDDGQFAGSLANAITLLKQLNVVCPIANNKCCNIIVIKTVWYVKKIG